MNIKINKPTSKLINKIVLLLPIVFFNFLLTNTASAIVALPSFGIGAVTHNSGGNGSCQMLFDDGNTADGVYMIDPFDNGNSFPVYCDMTTDGGGWTLVVGIKLDNRNHATQSAVAFTNLTNGEITTTSTGKLSDDVINQIANLEGSDRLLRFTCFGNTNDPATDYFDINNTPFNATAATNTSDVINTGWNTYSDWQNRVPQGSGSTSSSTHVGISSHNGGWGTQVIYSLKSDANGGNGGCWRPNGWNRNGTVYVR